MSKISAQTKGSSGASISPATTVVTETTAGQASAVGVSVNYAREDHTHGTPAAGAGGDLALTKTAPTANVTIPAGYSAVVVRQYLITATSILTIGAGAHLRIL
jgi:hypothetical protein